MFSFLGFVILKLIKNNQLRSTNWCKDKRDNSHSASVDKETGRVFSGRRIEVIQRNFLAKLPTMEKNVSTPPGFRNPLPKGNAYRHKSLFERIPIPASPHPSKDKKTILIKKTTVKMSNKSVAYADTIKKPPIKGQYYNKTFEEWEH